MDFIFSCRFHDCIYKFFLFIHPGHVIFKKKFLKILKRNWINFFCFPIYTSIGSFFCFFFNKNISPFSKLMLFGRETSMVRFKFDNFFFGFIDKFWQRLNFIIIWPFSYIFIFKLQILARNKIFVSINKFFLFCIVLFQYFYCEVIFLILDLPFLIYKLHSFSNLAIHFFFDLQGFLWPCVFCLSFLLFFTWN